MAISWQQLRQDALAIWQAGLSAVDSRRLVAENVRVEGEMVHVGPHRLPLHAQGRLVVVGAGKAGAGMAAGLIDALGETVCQRMRLRGWINVPEDCVRPLPYIELFGARPPAVNEPTPRGVYGSDRILELVRQLGPQDGCFCLLSGGASALLPAPVAEVPLHEKLALTRHLSAHGANIHQLNTVRKQLSRIKGGRLAAACHAGWLATLIISDVLGDPLDVIGSGPTVPDTSTPEEALAILEAFSAVELAPHAVAYLRQQIRNGARPVVPACSTVSVVIGNNATAVKAAAREAERREYEITLITPTQPEGSAEQVGRNLAATAWRARDGGRRLAVISGGEPTVTLVPPPERGKGGRNQQLVLAAFCHLLELSGHAVVPHQRPLSAPQGNQSDHSDIQRGTGQLPEQRAECPAEETAQAANPLHGIALVSGGTDGEDGPTDAAGAWIDEEVFQAWSASRLDPWTHLKRNDAYTFFSSVKSLLITGPTHTNVCDLRVLLVS
jgi:glycerate 2-kinase